MTTSETSRAAAVARVRVAEDAVLELRTALDAVGVTLPSVRIDPVSCARDEPAPLVDLGRCNLDAARSLSAVLRASQAARPGDAR